MESIIATLQQADTTTQALGLTIGGLIGVFATLTVFFIIIWGADKLGRHG